ncbi:MAG: alpha/beta hydrolase [Ardenticatenaceae bacterium]|nr:alpha/beta hydrolase [Ardenticatenaceae bacterium]
MFYQLNDLSLYYELHGKGQPVLMLHGRPNDHHVMKTAFEPIFSRRRGWQRIYLDLPGMGQSQGGSWLNGNEDVLDVVVQFMDDLFPHQPFIVIGFSYGGYLARGLLHKKHEQINGMFLMAPAVPDDPQTRILPPHRVIVSNPEGLSQFPPPFAEFLNNVLVVQDESVLAYQPEMGHAIQAANQEIMARLSQKPGFSFAADQLPTPFEKPVLILTGKHDSITGYEDAFNLLPHYPRATYAVLDRAGHGTHMEQPALFRALTQEWLDRVEECLV